jgi:hypothetical protein
MVSWMITDFREVNVALQHKATVDRETEKHELREDIQ